MCNTLDSTQGCGFELNVNTASCPQWSRGLSVLTARQIRREQKQVLPKTVDSDAIMERVGENNLFMCVCHLEVSCLHSLCLLSPDMWPHYCHPQTFESIVFNYSWTTAQHCLLGNQSQPRVNSLIGVLTSTPKTTDQRWRKGTSQSRGKRVWLFIKRGEDEREKGSQCCNGGAAGKAVHDICKMCHY